MRLFSTATTVTKILLAMVVFSTIFFATVALTAKECRNMTCRSESGVLTVYNLNGEVIKRFFPRQNKVFYYTNGQAVKVVTGK